MNIDDRSLRITTDVTLGLGAIAYPFMDIDLTTALHIITAIGGAALVWLRVCMTVRDFLRWRKKKRETLDT